MKKRENRTPLEAAAVQLRAISLGMEPGTLLGSEEALIAQVGCSRSTVRQAARLLEREGLLKVRRGISGGYFSARPDAGSIEAAVSSYLEYLDIDSRDVTIVASALWAEVMRKAANANPAEAQAVAKTLMAKVKAIKDGAPFAKVRELELRIQSVIFDLAKCAYVRLIFDINVAYSRRRFSEPIVDDTSDEHLHFVRVWRDSKLLELSAVADGDAELAVMAGQHSRKIWHRRIISRFGS